MKDSYEDIIGLPHHISATRPRMSMRDRAAQFAPFSALTGYGDAVSEVARLTDEKIELDEYERELIDRELKFVNDHIDDAPYASVKFFVSDEKKDGGRYCEKQGTIISIDEYERCIVFIDGLVIPIDNIIFMQTERYEKC